MRFPAGVRALRDVTAPFGVASATLRLRLGLRVVTVGAVAVAVAALGAAGDGLPAWVVVALLVGGIVTALRPDTPAPLAVLGVYLVAWVAVVDRGVSWWALPAAAGLATFHLAAAAAAIAPEEGDLPRPLVLRWVRGAPVLGACTLAVWCIAAVLDGRDLASSAVLSGIGLAALAAGGWLLATRSRADGAAPDTR